MGETSAFVLLKGRCFWCQDSKAE